MKIVCSKRELLKAMQMIQPIVSSKITLPILANFLIEAKKEENKIKFSATNLEVSIEFYIQGKIEKEGTITVPIKSFCDIIKEVSNCDIEIEIEETQKIKIKAQKSKFVLIGIDSKEYPILPQIKVDNKLLLDLKVLKDLFKRTLFCVSKDIQKYVITGVCFVVNNKEVCCVSTDGRRLSYIKKIHDNTIGDIKVVLPQKSVANILKMFSDNENEKIEISITDNLMAFNLNNLMFKTKLIYGSFPDYESILKYNKISKITINTEEMLVAVKQISSIIERNICFNDGFAIKLNFQKNKIIIFSNNNGIGFGETEIVTYYADDSFSVSVNPDYFKDILQNIENEKFEFIYCGSKQPIVIKLKDTNDFIHLIMPVI